MFFSVFFRGGGPDSSKTPTTFVKVHWISIFNASSCCKMISVNKDI